MKKPGNPYIFWLYELFATTLFIFLTTATWFLDLRLLGAFDSILGHFFALFCF
jgi:hypothetical protein